VGAAVRRNLNEAYFTFLYVVLSVAARKESNMDGRWVARFGKIAGLAGLCVGAFLAITSGTGFLEPKPGLSENHAFHLRFALLIAAFGLATIGIIASIVGKAAGRAQVRQMPLVLLSFAVVVILCAAIVGSRETAVLKDSENAGVPIPDSKLAKIQILDVPSFTDSDQEATARIAGTVSDVSATSNFRVVIVAFYRGNYYLQPLDVQPFTYISDGKWSNMTHRGDIYYAFLVTNKFIPKQGFLPELGKDVMASDYAPKGATQ
jgi:hypothetical protein